MRRDSFPQEVLVPLPVDNGASNVDTFDIKSWRSQAECIGADTADFFPEGKIQKVLDQTKAAKAVCRACDVARVCLEYSIVTEQSYGTWGGYDEDERRVIQRIREKDLNMTRWRARSA